MAVLVAAAGNRLRGDDGAGPRLLDILRGEFRRGQRQGGVRFFEAGGDPLALISKWGPDDRVLIVDAVRSGAPAGTIHRFDTDDGPIVPPPAAISSHGIGVAELLDLARRTGQSPARLVFYGVEGRMFDLGEGLSVPVEGALAAAAARIHAELVGWMRS